MARRTPIQVVVVRDQSDPQTDRYMAAIELAFEGRSRHGQYQPQYLSDAIDLKVHVLEPNVKHTAFSTEKLLRAAAHTILVVIYSGPGMPLREAQERFVSEIETTGQITKEQRLKVTIPPPKVGETHQLTATAPDEVELSLLPTATALHTLELARRTLSAALPEVPEVGKNRSLLRFFISHSKLDGVPAALSLISLMRQLRNLGASKTSGMDTEFRYFYDVQDIPEGGEWRKALEENARASVLIALRTNEYQNRYWRRAEYQWAEEMGVPIVVVDLRTEQLLAADRLPFGAAVTARLGDANMLRVLLHASASHFRFLRDQHVAAHSQDGGWQVLPRQPSAVSLAGALSRLKSSNNNTAGKCIYYPPPRLPDSYLAAVQPMLICEDAQVALFSMDDVD